MIQLMNLSFLSQSWPLQHHLNHQTLCFIKVKEIDCINLKDDVDDYSHVIPAGMTYIKGNFLERMESKKNSSTFKISKKCTFFYKESVVYSYAELLEIKQVLC